MLVGGGETGLASLAFLSHTPDSDKLPKLDHYSAGTEVVMRFESPNDIDNLINILNELKSEFDAEGKLNF